MDLIFSSITLLWVLIELIMFLLQRGNAAEMDCGADSYNFNDSDDDGTDSFNSSEFSFLTDYEDDSGFCGTLKPENKITQKRRQLFLAKRLARREHDRKIVLSYFQRKHDSKFENEDGYDSDYETTQAEIVELLVKLAEHIRWYKIVDLHNLSHKFQLTTHKIKQYLEELQAIGILYGVYDDRGKFIYVAKKELTVVSKFIEEQNLYDWPQIGLI